MKAIPWVPRHQLARDHRWSTTSNVIARVKIANNKLTTQKMPANDRHCPHGKPSDDQSIVVLRSHRPSQANPSAIHPGVKSP